MFYKLLVGIWLTTPGVGDPQLIVTSPERYKSLTECRVAAKEYTLEQKKHMLGKATFDTECLPVKTI